MTQIRKQGMLGELAAEFLGTFVLIMFGVGVVAQVVLYGVDGTGGPKGDYSNINWAWGLAVVMGIYVAGGITGAHLNPAVTLAQAFRGVTPWNRVLPYWGAQTVGAFIAALLVRWNYWEAFNKVDEISGTHKGENTNIFSTAPQQYISNLGGLRDQIIGTALLLLMILALTDARNQGAKANMGGLMVGLAIVVIGMAYGANAGYAINPARDFGPRLASWVCGWDAFSFHNSYWWVPIVGPLIGGVVGVLVYDQLIGRFLPWHGAAEEGTVEN